jgi:hypothetical protein
MKAISKVFLGLTPGFSFKISAVSLTANLSDLWSVKSKSAVAEGDCKVIGTKLAFPP